MTTSAAVTRFALVDSDNGARIRARRKALGMTAGRLASMAGVSREHLSAVENGHKAPMDEWVRRVELAMDRYARETGQEEPDADEGQPGSDTSRGLIRFTVEGVYGAKALVVEGPVENIAELEAAVDKIMRRLAGEQGDTPSKG